MNFLLGSYLCINGHPSRFDKSYISNARTKKFVDDCISVIITADGTCAGEVCHVNATCRNLIQGPTCVCKSGYQGSGKTCTGA